MKFTNTLRLLSAFLFVLSPWNTSAQIIPFPTDSAEWVYQDITDYGGCPTSFKKYYRLVGDTTINGLTYQIVLDNIGPDNDGFIRSDSNKVYFIPPDSTKEFLIYDFNLLEGDSFVVTWKDPLDPTDTAVVNLVDSIMTNDGYRKRWHFDYITWIEGIGSTNFSLTTFPYLAMVSGGYKFLCFTENDSLIYERTIQCWFDGMLISASCPGTVSIENSDLKPSISTSPNPFYNRFTIDYQGFDRIDQIQLFDYAGNFITNLPHQPTITLDYIPSGYYFLKITISDLTRCLSIVKIE